MTADANLQNMKSDMLINTDRLTLRRFHEEDGADLFAYLHAPTVSCFLSMAVADLEAATTEARRRADGDEYIAICLSDTGRLIGDLFAVAESDAGDTVSVGWHLNAEYAGAGFAFEAASALVSDLFSSQKARRIYAYVEDHNIRSQRLCERLGMRREGLFVEYVSFTSDAEGQPVFENTMQYAILRREWKLRRSVVPVLCAFL